MDKEKGVTYEIVDGNVRSGDIWNSDSITMKKNHFDVRKHVIMCLN